MSPIGHSLTGLAIGQLVIAHDWSSRRRAISAAGFILLANAPDLPLPYWGHERYQVSHSLFVTTAAVLMAAGIFAGAALALGERISVRLVIAGAAAWYSHLLLDTFYNHGKGLAMFWPVSEARLALPMPWFSTMRLSPLVSTHNLGVWATEAAFYGALLAAVVTVTRRRRKACSAILN